MDQWGVGRKGFDDGLVILFDLYPGLEHGQAILYGGPGYRAAFLDNGEKQRIYENEMLPRLDAFERVDDGVFRRVGLEVDTSAGVVACWTYVAGPALTRKLVPAQRVEKWPTAR